MDYLARASAIVAEMQKMRRELEALRLYQGSLRQGIREASEYATELQAIVQENKERALALTSPIDQEESPIEDDPAEFSSLSNSDDEDGSWGGFYASRGDDTDSEVDSDGCLASDSDSYDDSGEDSDNEDRAVEDVNDGENTINSETLPDPHDIFGSDFDFDFDSNSDNSDTDVETPFEDVYFTRRPHLVHPLTSTEAFFASSPPMPDERSLDWEDNAENIAPGTSMWDWQYEQAERAWNRGWRAIHARRPSYPEVPVLGEIVNSANSARVAVRERRERTRPIPRPMINFR